MAQHPLTRIGAGLIMLVKDLEGAAGEIAPEFTVRDLGSCDLGPFLGSKKDLARLLRSMPKNSASEIGRPSRTFFRDPTDGLIRFCSIREITALETPARLASAGCDGPRFVRNARSRAPRLRSWFNGFALDCLFC
jgi:hypothetical protein